MPNILEAASTGMYVSTTLLFDAPFNLTYFFSFFGQRLRVFSSGRTGHGLNRVCFTHGFYLFKKSLKFFLFLKFIYLTKFLFFFVFNCCHILVAMINLIYLNVVDNYCHGLILAERALYRGSPALGRFYIVTDGILFSFIGTLQIKLLNSAVFLFFSKLLSRFKGSTHTYKEGYANLWESMDEIVVSLGFKSVWSLHSLIS